MIGHEGTRGRYTNGCRCEGCTAANAAYQREWMRARYWKDADYRKRYIARNVELRRRRRLLQRTRELTG